MYISLDTIADVIDLGIIYTMVNRKMKVFSSLWHITINFYGSKRKKKIIKILKELFGSPSVYQDHFFSQEKLKVKS